MAKYREVIEQYPRTPTAPLAMYHLGNAQAQANDLPAAIETYQRFMLLYGSHSALAGLVQQRLAYSYLLKGDRDQAAKAFAAIVERPGPCSRIRRCLNWHDWKNRSRVPKERWRIIRN